MGSVRLFRIELGKENTSGQRGDCDILFDEGYTLW